MQLILPLPPPPPSPPPLAATRPADIRVGIFGCQADSLSLRRSWLSNLVNGQLSSNRGKEIRHVFGRLGRSLKEQETSLAGICLGVGYRHGTLVWLLRDKIEFVAGERNNDVFVRLALEFLDPRLGLVER